MKTPHIDRLASEGVLFTQMIAADALCSPSRAALLTGRYPIRSGIYSSSRFIRTLISPAQPGGLPQEEITIAEVLKNKGYKTGLIGKWHLGIHDNSGGQNGNLLPQNQGFDMFRGMPLTNVQPCGGKSLFDGTFFHSFIRRTFYYWLPFFLMAPLLSYLGVNLRRTLIVVLAMSFVMSLIFAYVYYFTLVNPSSCLAFEDAKISEQPADVGALHHRLLKITVDYIRENKDNPFFLFVPFIKVHTFLATSPEFANKSAHGAYGDNVEELDWSVGEIMKTLEENGLEENTLVMFSSDNGPFLEEGQEGGFAGFVQRNSIRHHLKGGKGQNWEGGIRIPGIFKWKNHIPSGVVSDETTSLMDIFPTLLELTNQTISDRVIDGKSILPLLLEPSNEKSPHDILFHYCSGDITAIRKGKYKAHFVTPKWEDGLNNCPSTTICACYGQKEEPPLLYDLESDPSESTPLDPKSSLYSNILESMKQARDAHSLHLITPVSQLDSLPRPWLMPCCNPPFCKCTYNDTHPV
eukprot:TRINITY_DN12935_c0_g1_i1.p1 TRINITY_DN12935_c0_g1~~TRINITY_DN12935_c0_g1_i1.p1  ORF type:complete len:591 (-),score=95.63 TRINITY_DN12935_c0_g1_i1:75-1637(-)